MTTQANQRASELFEEIADFLELKGENPFKVKAYQRAARVISGLDRSLEDLHSDGELHSIPGIGKAIAEKIGQFLSSGDIPLHAELASEFPPQILDLMDVPGLGAKKAATLYRELRIANLADLEVALNDGRVAGLKGFGARSASKLLDGIRRLKGGEKRTNLAVARRVAQELLKQLAAVPGVERVEAAGSLRRWRETVGDLDLLCQATDSQAVMDTFCGLVGEDRVLMKGDTRSSIRWAQDLQVDLRVVPRESFGAALQYFTGSKDHNVVLRGRAERMGYKLNEYGLYTLAGEKVAGADEGEIYTRLELPWIAPELRESGQEIELAQAGRLPDLVTLEQIQGNLHTHSEWSDGSDTLEELAREAISRGYRYLAITDHSRSLVIANGLSIERLREQGLAIARLQAELQDQLCLLRGTECDILADGSLDFPDEVLSELDLVVAAVHSQFQMGREEMTTRIIRAIENPHVDILAHPSGRLLGRRPGYEADWEAIFRAAAEHNTALEINCSPNRLDLNDRLAHRALELGCRLSLGTDAHSLREFDYLPFGLGVARRAGLTARGLLNTLSADGLLQWLRSPG